MKFKHYILIGQRHIALNSRKYKPEARASESAPTSESSQFSHSLALRACIVQSGYIQLVLQRKGVRKDAVGTLGATYAEQKATMCAVVLVAAFLTCVCLQAESADAQISGNRAKNLSVAQAMAPLSVAAANSHITIEGTCQKRITPTSIRLIWAVTAEEKEASACRKATQTKIEKTASALAALRIGKDKIYEDFISAIPRFEWVIEKRDDEQVLIETQTGYRMQTNLHIAVETNEQAMKVVEAALASGLTDLIGVDYAADLEQAQAEARLGAISAAKKKSETVLAAIFEVKPQAINVQEQTQVRFPNDMYDSFENVAANNLNSRFDDRRNRIAAYRPQNTYYAGPTKSADDKSYALPMKPEIIVESTVVIYYQSPSNREIVYTKSE